MISANYVDGLELRIMELQRKISDESNASLHLIAENQSLKAERDALKAQMNALMDAALDAFSVMDGSPEKVKLCGALRATPQQHLRELRAEALQSAIHAVANEYDGSDTTNLWCIGANHVLVLFAKYADSIRNAKDDE